MQENAIDLERLTVLIRSCVAAGKYFSDHAAEEQQVTEKTSAADVVTEVDKACEDKIRAFISGSFPEDALLGEEGTAPGASAARAAVDEMADGPHCWVIDPLDGTTNFVHKIPLSVVSVAYANHGQVMLGAVYDPYRDELFVGVRDAGAWLVRGTETSTQLGDTNLVPQALAELGLKDENKLAVSTVDHLGRAIVASGFPTRADDRETALQNGMAIVRKAKSLRGLGAAALHLAYVAAGRIEGFWEYDLNAWDIAAGSLLVEEAGGVVTDIRGDEYTLAVRNVVACGATKLAQEIRSLLAR